MADLSPAPSDFNRQIAHEITVAQLAAFLATLRPDDVLIPNQVRNLAIIRAGVQIGYIDLLNSSQSIEFFEEA